MRIIHLMKILYTWLLPYTCVLCHSPSRRTQDLCEPCHKGMPILPHSCIRCARELPIATPKSMCCGDCISQPPPFDKTYSLFSYENEIKKLILNLKFNEALVNARILGELLSERITHHWYMNHPLPDVIIPVPLHPTRLRERGFNQALEIARPIAKSLGIPIDLHSCHRQKNTAAQATLHAEKRKENVKNAFRITNNFSNRHIAIIDDVITTGQTMTALAKALKTAGARRIDVWCCARATTNKIKA